MPLFFLLNIADQCWGIRIRISLSEVWIQIRIVLFSHKGVERTEIMLAKWNYRVSYKKKKLKNMKKIIIFWSLKSLKKGVGCGVGFGSISQRYGSAYPDSRQNVTDPWRFFQISGKFWYKVGEVPALSFWAICCLKRFSLFLLSWHLYRTPIQIFFKIFGSAILCKQHIWKLIVFDISTKQFRFHLLVMKNFYMLKDFVFVI